MRHPNGFQPHHTVNNSNQSAQVQSLISSGGVEAPANGASPTFMLTAGTAAIGEGKTEIFTLKTTGVAAGSVYNYLLSGAGTDQVNGSLTGSVVIGSDGLAYISVNIINSGKSGPNQVLDLTVAGQKAHTTIIDAAPTSQTYTMTATQDTYNLTGTHNNLIVGTFGATTGQNNEAGGTFRSGDNISGNASASNTLSLFQNTDGGITGIGNTYDVLPVGINVQNINTILINSVQSLGDSSRALDTTGIDNISGTLTNLDINSSLGPDYVLAGAKTNIAVTNYGGLPGNTTTLGGNVTVNGGNNISVKTTGVTYSSSVSVGATTAAAGNVSVTDTNQVLGSDIVTFGGAAITASGFGNIAITNAASNVTVTDHGAHAGGAGNDVTINGGTNISATVNGGAINIAGVSGTVTTNSSGSGTVGISGGTNISVIDNNNTTIAGESGTVLVYSSAGSVNVQNGTSLTINAHGAVSIGNPFGGNPTGTITVTDSGGAAVNVYGGTTDTVTADGTILVRDYTGNAVNIHGTSIGSLGAGAILDAGGGAVNVTNYGGYIDQFGGIHVSNTGIQVGVAPIVVNNGDGTQSIGNIGVESKGNVNIQDNLNGVVGRGQVLAYTNGATSVTIVGGTAAGIEDVQSVALVRTPEGQPTPGVSTLSTVSLDSIAGNETIQSDALVNLSLSNSGVYAGDAGSATVVNRNAHTLNLSLSNDVAGSSLTDATATKLAVVTSGPASTLNVIAQQATQLALSGTSLLNLTGSTDGNSQNSQGLSSLKSITVSGGAGLNDLGLAGGFATYGNLTSIDGSHTTGDLTVTLNANQTFAGGSGTDTVEISADALATITGGTPASGHGPNVLVVNASGSTFTAQNTGSNVSGFGQLRTTANSGGTYQLDRVFNNISNIDVNVAPTAALTFAGASSTMTVSVDQSLGNLSSDGNQAAITLLQANANSTTGSLTLNLGTAATAGIDTTNNNAGQTISAANYNAVTVNSNGATVFDQGLGKYVSAGTNNATLSDKSLSSLTIKGVESLTIAGTGGQMLSTIDATGATATANLNLVGLEANDSLHGVTVTDGAAGLAFTGNVQSLNTDTVTYTAENTNNNTIVELGQGALQVKGGLDDGSTYVRAVQGVLLATLGNGNNDTGIGSSATSNFTAGNGGGDAFYSAQSGGTLTNTVSLGNGSFDAVNIGGTGMGTITVGDGTGDTIKTSDGGNMISIGVGSGETGGSATVTLGAGADHLTAGSGTYTIALGSGFDTINANTGAANPGGVTITDAAAFTFATDLITLGNGADAVTASNGNDSVTAGNGTNIVSLGNGNDTVTLGNGADTVSLGSGSNTVTLGSGNDTLSSGDGGGSFTIKGGAGTDTVTLGNGNNVLTMSGTGMEFATVANGNNTISAGNGTVTLNVGSGANSVTLGTGSDTVVLTSVSPSAMSFTTVSNAIAGDTFTFGHTNGTAAWVNNNPTDSQVQLTSNATFQDYLNAACSTNGGQTSQLSWFDFKGGQYLVEDNSSSNVFNAGTDQVLAFNSTTALNDHMFISASGNSVVLHG